MGVFKEEASAFKEIERNQHRIYNDAADYGYSYNTNNTPQCVKNVINIINEFKEVDKKFPDETPFIRNRFSSTNDVTVTIRIAWEKDGGYYNGTEYIITFCKVQKHPSLIMKNSNAFISVNSGRYSEPI